ncbi:MAG: hypothetical protein GTN89_16125 [Acidobacteria bacterium]|nr:hypothetical protein [Acidobacteriota bacterium]NIM62638.1 hypothetical protein [Acidobacteriota bacterium]NIO60756.1 hypothetical protein [Acidobacteriota bacterium]NIQ31827.1 hypothetical protein [Acidobacteriota bacterium]NIQ87154.1 hypothetical protein [Acidobacteriota bacterium]
MARRSTPALDRLLDLKFVFGAVGRKKKLALLGRLETESMPDADTVFQLHEHLCFMRAYPDDRRLLAKVESLLSHFEEREDLRLHRRELVNSGIAGTEIHFPFFWFTLRWLAERWPDRLRIDWAALRGKYRARFLERFSMILPYVETLALEEAAATTREWVELLKGPDETDAEFLVKRYAALQAPSMARERIFEEQEIPFRLLPGPDTPCATRGRFESSPVVFQKRPLVRGRESFRTELERKPPDAVRMGRRDARRLIDMARTLMVARTRDLDAFANADENDVRVLDYPGGFQLVYYGTIPERRQVLDAAYGMLMLRNGVTIGYVLSAALFDSAEVAYNVSPAFRGAEAAHLYAQCLNAVRGLFHADTFMVDPYQMGHGNPEGLRSGAWWFYYKLGFRPRDPKIAGMAEDEQKRVRKQRGYRSSIAKLDRLSSENMYLDLGGPRADVIGEFARDNVGLKIVRYLAERFGGDRERGIETCSREVARLLGLRSLRSLSEGERLAWDRWAPLVLLLDGVETWSKRDRQAAAAVIRAKGGRRESDFVDRFDRHTRLRAAVLELAAAPPEGYQP